MTEKVLGKITSARYGFGGYQDVQFGLSLAFDAPGWGSVGEFKGFWADDPSHGSEWTKADQLAYFGQTAKEVRDIMRAAKVDDVAKLVGKPVELTVAGNRLDSWRILEEIL